MAHLDLQGRTRQAAAVGLNWMLRMMGRVATHGHRPSGSGTSRECNVAIDSTLP